MASNRSAFEAQTAVHNYAHAAGRGLHECERKAFEYLAGARHESVLDIGIGAGRTIPFLSSMFDEYVGIDYAGPLVCAAREKFPGRQLLVMDARELSFPQTFDAIVFSYNGLDYMDDDDRNAVLERVSSHLRVGGLFIYSTHNLYYRRVSAWMRSFWVRELGFGRAIVRTLTQRLRHFWRQQACDGFAYVNDPGLGFSLITRYGDIHREMKILRRLGLETLAAIGAAKGSPEFDASDGWVYIVSRKICSTADAANEMANQAR